MIDHIPELVDAGIDSFKIEGRMKNALYVSSCARTYRRAIDDYFTSKETYEKNLPWYKEEIRKCTYRKFTTGFYFGHPDEDSMIYDSNTYINNWTWLGIAEDVDANGRVKITQRNKFDVGDEIEIMKPDGRDVKTKVLAMHDAEGNAVESCPHPQETIYLTLDQEAECGDILRTDKPRE